MDPENPDTARRRASLWLLLVLLGVFAGTLGVQAARYAGDAAGGKVLASPAATGAVTTTAGSTAPEPTGEPPKDQGGSPSSGGSSPQGGGGSSPGSAPVAPAAPAPPGTPSAPTIGPSPAVSPTSSATITFTLVNTWTSAVTFQCSLDGTKFAACLSPVTVGSLGDGSHTFEAKAAAGGKTSPASAYAWRVDRTAPTVVSAVRTGPSPTNAASVGWRVTFSEAVTGVTLAAFSLNPTVTGASLTAVSPISATVYTVSATTGTGDGTLTLRVGNGSAIKDAAQNPLGGTLPFVGQAYVIDKTPPPAPTITAKPPALSSSTNASFSFTAEAGATLLCKLDAGAFTVCTSPQSYSGLAQGTHTFAVQARDAAGNTGIAATWAWAVDTVAPATPVLTSTPPDPSSTATSTFDWSESSSDVVGYECSTENGPFVGCGPPPITYAVGVGDNVRHRFAVRAVDAAGNRSGAASYTWKVVKGSGQDYAINGTVSSHLYPGGAAQPIDVGFDNPNAGNGGSGANGVQVSNLTVAITSVTGPNITVSRPCNASDFALVQFSGAYPFFIPPGVSSLSTLVPSIPSGQWPSIRLINKPTVNQDGCRGATINLSYAGTP